MNPNDKNDRAYNPYGMDFLGNVEYDSSLGVLEYERGAVPDPEDRKIAASLFLANEENNRRTGKNVPLRKIVVSDIGGGVRMFAEPGPDPRFMTFDFPDGISEEDVEAFKTHIDNCQVFTLAKPPKFVPPSAVLDATVKECVYCGETPCFLDQTGDDTSGKTMKEFLFGGKGDELYNQGILNREIRFVLYRDATTFISGYLGKGNRKELPDCVVREIRGSYPAEGGNYVGFKKGFLVEDK